MRVGWIGFHMEGLQALSTLLKQGKKIEAVITLKEEQRAKRSGGIDYTELCKRYEVPLFKVSNINNEESIRLLRKLALDVVFVLGWSQIIKDEVLRIPRLGMIGAHASFLPHNRGSAPINWALIKGEKETGNTLMWLSPGVDTGDIIDQMRFPITPYDTCRSLYERVAETNKEMILKLYPMLVKGEYFSSPQPQDNKEILPRRKPQHGLVDWSKNAVEVYNFVRALTRPYPGAFSFLGGKKWFIWQSALLPEIVDVSQVISGEVIGSVCSPVANACGQIVKCGSGVLLVLEVEEENGEVIMGRELSNTLWKGLVWSNG